MNEKSTILVCVDTTNASAIALKYAFYKAKKNDFTVDILAVIESSHKGLLFGSNAVGKDKRIQVEEHLNKIIKELNIATGIMPTVQIREGDISSEIIREIKNNSNCVMLILGKSMVSLSDNTVLPSISKRVGDKIRIPVMIIPENINENCLKKLYNA